MQLHKRKVSSFSAKNKNCKGNVFMVQQKSTLPFFFLKYFTYQFNSSVGTQLAFKLR